MSFNPAQADLLLPDYSVRISPRAKRLQLKVKPTGEVEVVVPKGVALRHVPVFVAKHEDWLRKTLNTIEKHHPADAGLPGQIELPAVNEYWQVEYIDSPRSRALEHHKNALHTLKISGRDKAHQRAALQQWLSRRAAKHLIPRLQYVSREVGLPFTQATVRAQKTRWGSCSSQKHISLNRALMFMPPDTVRYLFIHELCHTIHMNHSARYWALVAKLEPDHRHHETTLRRAIGRVPRWALPD